MKPRRGQIVCAIVVGIPAMLGLPCVASAYVLDVYAAVGANYVGEILPGDTIVQYDSGTTSPLGATSQAVLASQTQYIPGFGTLSGLGTASADLSTGALHAYASSSSIILSGSTVTGAAIGNARILETITFDISGANSATATSIGFRAHVDGSFSGPYDRQLDGFNLFNLDVYDGNVSTLQLAVPSAIFGHEEQHETYALPQYLSNLALGWTTSSISNAGPDMADFAGTYVVRGAAPVISIFEQLEVSANGTTEDFQNTGFLDLVLPNGVTFTSTSGVFLSKPISPGPTGVPEPATFAMLAVGLAGIGLARRSFPKRDA